MNRRNRIEIIVDILYAASKGSNRTRIMYQANLNFGRFERYFKELLDKGLIETVSLPEANACPTYKTTEKARALLEELEKVEHYIGLTTKNKKMFYRNYNRASKQ